METAEPRTSRVVALVLTGGRSRRMGRHKPTIEVGGQTIVGRVLAAVAGWPAIVVGLPDGVPPGVRVVSERPPRGGPVAALGAGLAAIEAYAAELAPSAPDVVVVLAADLPLLTREHVESLVAAARLNAASVSVTQGAGGPNWLCAAWPARLLADRLRQLDELGTVEGASMRALVGDTPVHLVPDPGEVAVDVDTPADLDALQGRLAKPTD